MTRPAILVLCTLLAGALAIRITFGLTQPADDPSLNNLPDQREYLELGRNLVRGEGLKFVDPRFDDEVFAFRTPGYPLLVAACGGNVRAVRIVQAVLDTSTVLAMLLLARRWLDVKLSLIAAAIVALNPFLIYFSTTLLSETLFIAMLAWGMTLLMTRWRFATLAGGLVLALSILVRPSAIALPVVLGFAGLFANRPEPTAYLRRWSVPVGAMMVALTLLVLMPWALRNKQILGQWIWTTTNAGITTYDGFNPDATGASNQHFVKDMPQLRDMNEIERSRYLAGLAEEYVRENPRRAIELTVAKVLRTWSPVPLSSEYAQRKYQLVGLLYSVPLDVLVLIGICWGRLPKTAKAFLLIPAIYLTAVHAMSVGSLRYRVPAEAPMAVIAASAFSLVRRVQAVKDDRAQAVRE